MRGVLAAAATASVLGCTNAKIVQSTGEIREAGSDAAAAQTTDCVTHATYDPNTVYDPIFGDFSTDVLPEGACAPNAPVCRPILRPQDCGCPRYPGPASFYECSCSSGQWSCKLLSVNGNVCEHRPCADAGALDATDGATTDSEPDGNR